VESRPKLLDLFCGAGGSAMGLHRAGFEVVGVDIKPQPHYPFTFIKMDALLAMDLLLGGKRIYDCQDNWWSLALFDAYWASPPCQSYSISQYMQGVKGAGKYIEDVRSALAKIGRPFVIENVPGAPLENAIELSGMSFGLKIIRRRLFELHGFDVLFLPVPRSVRNYRAEGYVPYHHGTSMKRGHLPNIWTKARLQEAMGIDWMSIKELTQAIPPAYSEYLGKHLIKVIQ